MKKSYEKNRGEAASLREAMAPLDERCPLPRALGAEHVLRNAAPPRRGYAAPLRRGLALAAALAVVVSASVLSDRLNVFSGGKNALAPLPEAPVTERGMDFGTSYYELEQAFLRLQKEQQKNNQYNWRFPWGTRDMMVEEEMTMPAAMDAPGETARYADAIKQPAGETNTQVRGVDEADILKNDGKYLYYIQGGRLLIIQALPELKVLSSISIPHYRLNTELYVRGDRMALVYSEYPPGGDPAASVQVYDIADRGRPLLVKTFSQPGSLLSSRMIASRVYLLSTQWANLDFRVEDGVIPPEDILPVVYEDSQPRILPAGCIAIMPDAEEPGYLLVSSLDIGSSRSESESAAILGAGSQVYCSGEALFVACQQWQNAGLARSMPWGWNVGAKTLIYKFDLLPEGKIKASGSGEAPGAPLNQFSMDEYGGYFRIATTGNREKDGETVNFITVLDGSLKQVGGIENIAPGERIQSARFLGGKGYLVTFRQTDPLFVVDLEDPRDPKILGELKLPGFSAYLHPWDATHLIGIGPGGNDRGTDNSMKVSLFDISDPARPREVDKVVVPNTYSDIQQNHRILTVCAEKGVFGLPLGGYEFNYGYGYGSSFYTFQVQGDRVSRGWTLEPVKPDPGRDTTPYYAFYGNDGMRGTYIADTWYVLGMEGVAAYAMESGTAMGEVRF